MKNVKEFFPYSTLSREFNHKTKNPPRLKNPRIDIRQTTTKLPMEFMN